ncbi:hypothetical protein HPB48_022248 [Haemaphysalis longicornis]|uniref:alpha-glucosidase n=1 Tax=Haemaphysalis longicornis TaxID=44386 RepID=A0A9J6GJB5_HAELO|nr:hypothetical protein HPB48_022248 [Haemaphysalis longicornis]
MYEVFVASFVNLYGDEFSDFHPLTSCLWYTYNRVGVSAIWLTYMLSALDYSLEYWHIIDFDYVDLHLGHIEGFAVFLERADVTKIRVALGVTLAFTSEQHSWAAHWLLDPYGEYGNYYVLKNDSSLVVSEFHYYAKK